MPRDLAHHGAARQRVHARSPAFALDLIDSHGQAVTAAGLYGSLAVIYGWFGGMKFTRYEAEGLVGLVSNNPLLSWIYSLFSVESFSNLLGILELSIAVLIVARLIKPIYSLVGGLLSAGLFSTTLSFMATTPGVFVPELGFPAISVAPGQFLLKDAGLFALSLWIAIDSFAALRATRA
uniref:YkgB family protein n=1 Tax=Sinorhizobium chiapasense TaxID=501572 RepID=UPI002FE18309